MTRAQQVNGFDSKAPVADTQRVGTPEDLTTTSEVGDLRDSALAAPSIEALEGVYTETHFLDPDLAFALESAKARGITDLDEFKRAFLEARGKTPNGKTALEADMAKARAATSAAAPESDLEIELDAAHLAQPLSENGSGSGNNDKGNLPAPEYPDDGEKKPRYPWNHPLGDQPIEYSDDPDDDFRDVEHLFAPKPSEPNLTDLTAHIEPVAPAEPSLPPLPTGAAKATFRQRLANQGVDVASASLPDEAPRGLSEALRKRISEVNDTHEEAPSTEESKQQEANTKSTKLIRRLNLLGINTSKLNELQTTLKETHARVAEAYDVHVPDEVKKHVVRAVETTKKQAPVVAEKAVETAVGYAPIVKNVAKASMLRAVIAGEALTETAKKHVEQLQHREDRVKLLAGAASVLGTVAFGLAAKRKIGKVRK